MHIHISVDDLESSKRFYSAIFGQEPTMTKPDYAKWSLDDPRVNLAISKRCCNGAGVNHLGIQAETGAELEELHRRMEGASYTTEEQKNAQCCYARSDKHWAVDPAGIPWEMFHTMEEVAYYGNDNMKHVA